MCICCTSGCGFSDGPLFGHNELRLLFQPEFFYYSIICNLEFFTNFLIHYACGVTVKVKAKVKKR